MRLAMAASANSSSAVPGEVAVLVPAAGQGTRLGGQRKQFRTLGGKPLLIQTLLAFEQHPDVDRLIVAVPPERVRAASDALQAAGLVKLTAVVRGGASRQESVRRALRAVPASVAIVLVHDAVRPFIAPEAIRSVIEAVQVHDAAALAVPVADTLRKGHDEQFGETVSRSGLYRMQTPQGARRALFEAAHRQAVHDGFTATDDVELVQQLGQVVHIVPGRSRNIKITTPEDWALAQQLWNHWKAKISS